VHRAGPIDPGLAVQLALPVANRHVELGAIAATGLPAHLGESDPVGVPSVGRPVQRVDDRKIDVDVRCQPQVVVDQHRAVQRGARVGVVRGGKHPRLLDGQRIVLAHGGRY
jgi:hypothetical protein